jgi:hypothetical protein
MCDLRFVHFLFPCPSVDFAVIKKSPTIALLRFTCPAKKLYGPTFCRADRSGEYGQGAFYFYFF